MPRSVSAIQADLDVWYAARTAVSRGQSYTVDGQAVTRASLSEINTTIRGLESELSAANGVVSGNAAQASGFGLVRLLREY